MQPIIREKNDINFENISRVALSAKTELVLEWFMKSSSSVQSIIEYDWSDSVGIMEKASDTEKAQSLANWIIRNRADLTLISEENDLRKISPTAQKRYDSIAGKAYTVMTIVSILLLFFLLYLKFYSSIHLERAAIGLMLSIPVVAIKGFLIFKKEKIISEEVGK